jgi:hypothetical protein
MIWYRIMTNKGWRVFPQSLTENYLKWISVDPSKYEGNLEETIEVAVDHPGMVAADRTWQDVEIQGLTISFPSTDFGSFLAELEESSPEIAPGGIECYKIRGWLAGVILLPDMREQLIEKMSEMYPAVEIIADKENAEFMRRMREINRDGVKVISGRALALEAQENKDKKLPN